MRVELPHLKPILEGMAARFSTGLDNLTGQINLSRVRRAFCSTT